MGCAAAHRFAFAAFGTFASLHNFTAMLASLTMSVAQPQALHFT